MTKLELNLPEKTLKKLRAYAMLTGAKVSDLEAKLVELVDKTLTDSVASALVDLDGTVPSAFQAPHHVHNIDDNPRLDMEAVVGKAPNNQEEQFELPITQDETTGNELSSEDAPDEVKALDEDPINEEELKVDIAAPNVDGNANGYS